MTKAFSLAFPAVLIPVFSVLPHDIMSWIGHICKPEYSIGIWLHWSATKHVRALSFSSHIQFAISSICMGIKWWNALHWEWWWNERMNSLRVYKNWAITFPHSLSVANKIWLLLVWKYKEEQFDCRNWLQTYGIRIIHMFIFVYLYLYYLIEWTIYLFHIDCVYVSVCVGVCWMR